MAIVINGSGTVTGISVGGLPDGIVDDGTLANDVVVSTSGAITTTGAFTSIGIDDNASASAVEIDSSGNVLVGTWAGDGTSQAVKIVSDAQQGQILLETDLTSSRNMIVFVNGNGVVGTISTSSSATSYNESSDYRLKENVVPMTDSIDRLKGLKPSRFNFITDADNTVDGFLAHEVSSVVPEAISGEKDAMTTEVLYVEGDELPEGKNIGDVKEASVIDPQGIDKSKLVPLLVSALQEAITRIETLENA